MFDITPMLNQSFGTFATVKNAGVKNTTEWISADATVEFDDNKKNWPKIGDIVRPIGIPGKWRVIKTNYKPDDHNIEIEKL